MSVQVGEIWHTTDGECYDEMNRGLWVVLLNALMRTEGGDWPAMPEPAAGSSAQLKTSAEQASAADAGSSISSASEMVEDAAVWQRPAGLARTEGSAEQLAAVAAEVATGQELRVGAASVAAGAQSTAAGDLDDGRTRGTTGSSSVQEA